MGRVVSITFDDGLARGAAASAEILERYGMPGVFYVVTGWVEPMRAPIRDDANMGRSHGDWNFWRRIATAGHEVGSHTFSHFKAGGLKAALTPWRVAREIARSQQDLQREIPAQSHTISMPWNAASPLSDRLVRRAYSACRVGGGDVQYNRLSQLRPYALRSWAPGPRHDWGDYVAAIEAMPQDGWLILGFHSLEDEGWEPISANRLDQLCTWLRDNNIEVATVRDVVARTKLSCAP